MSLNPARRILGPIQEAWTRSEELGADPRALCQPGIYGAAAFFSAASATAWTPAVNLPSPINSPAFEVGPKVTPDGRTLLFTSTRRTFAVTPPDKALSYAELSRQLNSPGNGLGDLYQVDLQTLRLERPWR